MKNNNWFTITKVHPQVYALAEFNHWEQVVSYLFLGKYQAILIDTGMGYQNIKHAIERITKLPVTVLLTHAHWDHIGGVNIYDQIFVYNHPFEKKLLEQGFYSSEIGELSNSSLFDKPFKSLDYQIKGIKNYQLLKDEIKIDDFSFKVIHTPGHTPGSVCFYEEKLNILFTGDTLYPGPLYIHLTESCFEDFVISINKLKDHITKNTIIFPGHNRIKCSSQIFEALYLGANQVNEGIIMADTKDKDVSEYVFKKFSILIKD
jgi:glyoxylase-like metal-dependent hydrolase (beta-lactamase superfamily II)